MIKVKGRGLYKIAKLMGRDFYLYIVAIMGENFIRAFCYNIVMAVLMRDLFNAASQGSSTLFLRAIIIALSSLILAIVLQPIFVYISKKIQKKTMQRIRTKAYNHLIGLPISYYEKEHSGNIISRLTNDIKIIEEIYDFHIPHACFIFFLGTGSAILMFAYNWQLALFAVLLEITSVYISIKISKNIRRKSKQVQSKQAEVNERFLDIVSGFKTSKLFQLEEILINKYIKESNELTGKTKKRDNLNIFVTTSSEFFYSLKSMGLIAIGLYMVLISQMDIGTIAALFNLHNNVGILSNLGDVFSKIQSSLAGLDRVLDLLEEKVESDIYLIADMSEGDKSKYHTTCNKDSFQSGARSNFNNDYNKKIYSPCDENIVIEIKNLDFAYKNIKVLDDISLSVKKGECIALIGKSGSGKSTIGKLLMGLYKFQEGNVFIEGKRISDYSLSELRDKISYVPQDACLFSGTVKDNIRYGRLDASEDEIIEAAKMANAHGFIMEMENTYNSYIGERGSNLSGGQRQRIAIARAILKDSPIIILDEPTSALDPDTERLVQDALEKVMIARTLLIITHKVSATPGVNRVVEVDKGQIVKSKIIK